jgi:hypothetical protein
MGSGSTPGHKPRSPVGRRAVCTERHQRGGGAVGSGAVRVLGPGRPVNACCQSTAAATEANPGGFWGPFGCSRRLKNKPAQKIFFVKKWTYGTYGLPAGPKVGQFFFFATPKFYPRQKDPKRVLSAGAWGLVPKSAVWGPPNGEIRNLRPPKFGINFFFGHVIYFSQKFIPKGL